MSSDAVVSLRNVGKSYRIYDKPQDRLKESLMARLHRLARPLARLSTREALRRPTYYREFWALRDVTLDIQQGETFGIVGLNGSGKSTLLQIIAGTLNPSGGDVVVKGRIAALLELGSGFSPEFTGRENVYMNGAILGLTREQIDSRFDAIAAFADIGEFIDQPVKTYSSGMSVRLAFAVIAHVDADILLIDEVLAVGDVLFAQKCMRFLRSFQSRGTIIFVSHDSGAVVNLCHRALWLQQGRARMVADAKTVSEAYLESFYEHLQGPSDPDSRVIQERSGVAEPPADQRLQFINDSTARNDIELFSFNPDGPSFGKGGAKITDVDLLDVEGRQLTWVVGGENVILRVRAEAQAHVEGPIVGFFVKDRLGQTLFGDNTFLTYCQKPQNMRPGGGIEVRFAFAMPILPAGDYSVCVAFAEGTQENHVQHHWIHDAMQFRSHSSSVSTGLVGIPMRSIDMRAVSSERAS
jgi:homopolymeric O-antigen transport system ATP-binding protein